MPKKRTPTAKYLMAEPPQKEGKLSGRHLEVSHTVLFDDISDLDAELERLMELGSNLAKHPDLWQALVEELDYLKGRLIQAYIEYERDWQKPEWQPEEDLDLMACLQNHQKMRVRVKFHNFRAPRDEDGNFRKRQRYLRYSPAQLACANCLYLLLLFEQSPCTKKAIHARLKKLEFQLTRYTAASLADYLKRLAVFASSKAKDSSKGLRKLIAMLIREHGLLDNETLWKCLKRESNPREAIMKNSPVRVQYVDDYSDDDEPRIDYWNGEKQMSLTKRRVQNILSRLYTGSRHPPLQYLKSVFSRDPSMEFPQFWGAIQAECEERTIRDFASVQLVCADDEQLVYRFRVKEFRVAKRVVWHKFRIFKRKK
ncbi:hypothetical protein SAMN05216420_11094 [Nitrosospira sp. Nl5]|uniref:hypothetical protein n=1 Tax=Nitrosospira sp. Nl5 TaxID=200120 RepID=UPI0008850A0F|nr:hypothetical protein [Nitrosospira sp. Nl5]SCY62545.1 hypothetical protein SAMN05216420_11094 [Nitrosospira sp. Nl5]